MTPELRADVAACIASKVELGSEAIPLGGNGKDEHRDIFPRLSVEENLRTGFAAVPRRERTVPLLLDEPTEGIQPSIIKQVGEVIGQLAARGEMAVLLVEQYLEFARAIADELVVMDRGEVVVAGPTSEVDEALVKRYLTV